MPDGLLLVAHGSRSAAGQAEMWTLADLVATAAPHLLVEMGYLEMSDPPAGEALDRLVARGARRIAAVPLMLLAAGHSKSDVPAVILEGRLRHPDVAFHYGRPLGTDQTLISLARRRIVDAGGGGLPLALFARGTSDPDANAEACKIGRLLAEATGSQAVITGFSGVTWPSPGEAFDQLRRLGALRIATFSWFLATGVLVARLDADRCSFAEASGVETVNAGHFGPSPEIAGLVLARAHEALGGQVRMNCDTCSYRAPFPGLESRVGQALGEGHSHLAAEHRHAHAEVGGGISTGAER